MCYPPILEEHIIVCWLSSLVCFSWGYDATPLQAVRVPLQVGRSILCQGGRQLCLSFWHGGYLLISLPPFCFALPTVTQFCDWSHSSQGSLSTSINGCRHCSLCLCMCSFQSLQPNHVTCGLHPSSVDAPVDIHGRSCNLPFFHPREALLVGHWVTTLPLSSCGILIFSPPTEVVLHGVGLVHLSCVWWLPIHKRMPISDVMRRSWFQWRTHDHPHWFITS